MQTELEPARRCNFGWRYLSLLVLAAAALTACAGAGAGNDRDGGYVYRSDDNYVRLAPIEAGAAPNSHPFAISAGQLSRLLAGIEVSGAASIGRTPVFSPEELQTVAPPLASALSKAGPKQDVTFAVTRRQGLFGRLAPKAVTTGRAFVRGDSLHLIFGVIQQRMNRETLEPGEFVPEIVPGTRSRRIDVRIGQIEPGGGRLHERRGDWLVFDGSAIPAAAATPAASGADANSGGAAPAAPTIDSKAQEVEQKLRVLDALRERGVITEQEYRERRRAILEQL